MKVVTGKLMDLIAFTFIKKKCFQVLGTTVGKTIQFSKRPFMCVDL